jgi:hypothetical protein
MKLKASSGAQVFFSFFSFSSFASRVRPHLVQNFASTGFLCLQMGHDIYEALWLAQLTK